MNVLLEFTMFPEKLVGRSQFEWTPHNPTSPFFFQLCFLRIGKNMWWLTKANFITHQNLRVNHYPPSAWGSEPEPSLQKKKNKKQNTSKHRVSESWGLELLESHHLNPTHHRGRRPPNQCPGIQPYDVLQLKVEEPTSSRKWDAETKKWKGPASILPWWRKEPNRPREPNLRPGTFPTPSCRYCWSCRYRWLCPSLDASYVSPTGKRLRPLQHRAVHGGCLPGETRVKDGDRQDHQDLGVVFGGCFFLRWQNHQKMRRYDIPPDICRVLFNGYDFQPLWYHEII